MRDLASIVTVESVQKMFEKDRIVAVTFKELGFEAIVPSTVKVGDTLAFIQEGSILPEVEAWEFLRKRCYSEKEKGFIIRPMTMGAKDYNGEKGERVKSWGLAVSLEELPIDKNVLSKLKAGDDITDLLNIRKYEPVEDASPTRGDSKKSYPKWVKFCLSHVFTRWIGRIWQKRHQNSAGGFPSSIITKSDETCVQNMKYVLERFKDSEVYTSVKMEGQSFTVVPDFKGKKLKGAYVCSRNNAYTLEDKSLFWEMMRQYDIANKYKRVYKDTGDIYVFQGEQVGPGIQDNIYDFTKNYWFVFTVKDYKTGKQLPLEEAIKVSEMFGLRFVPILEKNVKLGSIMPDINTAVSYAEKVYWTPEKDDNITTYKEEVPKGELWKDFLQHEGVVVRTMNYDKDKGIGVSFKVKNCDYASMSLGEIHKKCVSIKNNL
jgi:signal peptidase I